MHINVPLVIAIVLAVGIVIIGGFYVVSPEKMTGSFGLKQPSPDANTRAWLRLKGIRDIVSGLVVIALVVTTDQRTAGVAFLVEPLTAFGDMSNVLASDGSKRAALTIHGATFAIMVVTGLFLIHVL